MALIIHASCISMSIKICSFILQKETKCEKINKKINKINREGKRGKNWAHELVVTHMQLRGKLVVYSIL